MRVVLVTNGLRFGGAERIVETLATGLAARGADVRVVATTRDGPIGASLRAAGLEVDILHLRHAFDAGVVLDLARIVRRHRADVVHSHIAISDLANAMAHGLVRSPRIVSTVHSPYIGLSRPLRAAWHASLHAFHAVFAVSASVERTLPRTLHVERVPASLAEPSAIALDRATARARLGLDRDVPLALAIGRLVQVKGFDVLAVATEHLRTPNARVLLIGDGPESVRLRNHSRLEQLGARDDAADLLPAADVLVVPSRSEGFPQIVLQAMAVGLPVVATRVGGTPELVHDQQTGLLVRSEDPVALAKALDALLTDLPKARALGAEGAKRLVSGGLTRSAMLERHLRVYESLISGRSPGRSC